MSKLGTRLDAIKGAFEASMPNRIFTRNFVYRDQLRDEELEQGVLCLISGSITGFDSPIERELMEGHHTILLSAQTKTTEKDPDLVGTAIEELEHDLFDEVKATLENSTAPELCQLDLKAFQHSGQVDAPYGFALFEFNYSYS